MMNYRGLDYRVKSIAIMVVIKSFKSQEICKEVSKDASNEGNWCFNLYGMIN